MFGSDSSDDGEPPRDVMYSSDHRQHQQQHRRGTGRGGGGGDRREDYSYVHHRGDSSRRYSRGGGVAVGGAVGGGSGSDVSGLEGDQHGGAGELCQHFGKFRVNREMKIKCSKVFISLGNQRFLFKKAFLVFDSSRPQQCVVIFEALLFLTIYTTILWFTIKCDGGNLPSFLCFANGITPIYTCCYKLCHSMFPPKKRKKETRCFF